MKLRVVLVGGLIVVALATACGPSQSSQPRARRPGPGAVEPSQQMLDDAARDFVTVRDGFLEWYLESYPVRASELGIHAHDDRLPALDRAAVQRRIDDLLDWLSDLEQVPFVLMREENRYDYAVLEYALRAELLDLEELRSWANEPAVYTRTIAGAIASVAEREYAPLDERLEALRNRMQAAVTTLEAARENLTSPPALWTELAVEDARGLVHYLDATLPGILAAQGAGAAGTAENAGVEPARQRLVAALGEHVDWLERDLLPRSTGTYRLGRYLFQRKLLYEEHVTLAVEELEQINDEAIAEYQDRVEQVAAEIDSDRSAREVMDSITHLYPDPAELIPTAREMMEEVRVWVETSGVVTLPDAGSPTVRESPAYARGAFAFLDAPGPFESPALEAFYNLTNVLPEWSDEQIRQHMSYFNY
ncbi:MAG: DUF885 family protein, partial [Gemmatimonadetes bacterium]|nr:DUF885 domain-containing protein [Gemmatimonadota bacterium]NIY36866.1 DUF885 family protein [Gemmatimonadota bacterium]